MPSLTAEMTEKITRLRNLSRETVDQLLTGRDYVVLVDQSASMGTLDCSGNSRWDLAKEIVNGILAIAKKYDQDGSIDLLRFGAATSDSEISANYQQGVTSVSLPSRPGDMSTKFGHALDWLFKNHFSQNSKPLTIVVLLDGEVGDKDVTRQAIRNAAEAAGDGESLAIALWQIGYDSGAATFLKELDDNLGEIDIVDTSPMDELIEMFTTGDIDRLLVAAIID